MILTHIFAFINQYQTVNTRSSITGTLDRTFFWGVLSLVVLILRKSFNHSINNLLHVPLQDMALFTEEA